MPWAVWLPSLGTGSLWASSSTLWRLPADPVWSDSICLDAMLIALGTFEAQVTLSSLACWTGCEADFGRHEGQTLTRTKSKHSDSYRLTTIKNSNRKHVTTAPKRQSTQVAQDFTTLRVKCPSYLEDLAGYIRVALDVDRKTGEGALGSHFREERSYVILDDLISVDSAWM